MFYDTHTHTKFSADSQMSIDSAVDAAIKNNLKGIAFTDHFDYNYSCNGINENIEFDFDFNEYFEAVSIWREKLKGTLDILFAVEIGFQPESDVYNAIKERLAGFQFDYIIGSTHVMNQIDPYYGKFYEDPSRGVKKTKLQAYGECLECIYKNIDMYDDFDTMGHFDYHIRYAPFEDSAFYYRDFPDQMDAILKNIISKNKALEINTKTYVKNPLDIMVLKRYKELGGEMVTIGSDAHSPEFVGLNFKETAEIIRNAGFNYLTYFKNRTPVLYKI